VKVTRDRTEQHAAEVAIEESLGRFAELAHDLRQPLNVVVGYASLLGENELLESQDAEMLREITNSAAKMTKMAEDILDFARLTLSDRSISPAPLDLATAIDRSVATVAGFGVDHDVEIEVEDRLEVVADEAALDRVLINLLMNADKYSPPAVPIRVVARRQEGTVVLQVIDQGPGIPEDLRDRLFTPFGAPVAPDSVGLGLSICRRYVELHGGHLWAAPGEPTGTTMTFTLPLLALTV
jgi:two-component system sensor histidine kinase KdpD